MKKTIFILLFVQIFFYSKVSSDNIYFNLNSINLNVSGGIQDGWYQASVKYTNYSTGTYATYSLNVQVQYDRVVTIDFGNGGSVHTGFNNEGYLYSGGYLSYDTDYDGNITAATTTVSVSDSDGIRYFKITIE